MENLKGICEKVKAESHTKVRLYLITRNLKPGVAKTKKMLDKFLFNSYSIDIEETLQKYLLALVINQIEAKITPNYELVEYDIIDDNTEKLYTYTLKDNMALPFANTIKEQLKKGVDIKPVMKLEEIKDNIWAYCIGILHDDKKPTYTFKKFYSSKIAVDEPVDGFNKLTSSFRAIFNTKNSKLELLKGETLSFDKNIDCIFLDDKFYILSKKQFEKIVGLEEEFKEHALKMVEEISTLNLIEGIEILIAEIDHSPSLLRKLARLAQRQDYKDISSERIKKMKAIAAQHGYKLKVENGKLKITDSKDIDLIIKMLDDYFVESKQTGLKYGSHAKKQLKVVTTK